MNDRGERLPPAPKAAFNNLLDAAFGASIASRPPSPEPSTYLTMVSGLGIGWLMLRRNKQS